MRTGSLTGGPGRGTSAQTPAHHGRPRPARGRDPRPIFGMGAGRGVGGVHSTAGIPRTTEPREREGTLVRGASHRVKGRESGASLTPPPKLRRLQEARYTKAKQEPAYRFYLLYDKVARMDILEHAYALSKQRGGAPGVDGVTFADIEAAGTEQWLAAVQEGLRTETYRPHPVRRVLIPKPGGTGERPLGIPVIQDRVVQTTALLILQPIFEADLEPTAYGYQPGRPVVQAVQEVHRALCAGHTEVMDADLSSYFDSIPHAALLQSLARRLSDRRMLRLLKRWLKAPVTEQRPGGGWWFTGGKGSTRGTPQGGCISPVLSNLYPTEVDRMLERAKAVTRSGKYTRMEYARFADDLVILVDAYPRHGWLLDAVTKRLREELALLHVEVNEEKSRLVDLAQGERFGFLGFDFQRVRSKRGVWRPQYTPQIKKRTAVLRKLKEVFRHFQSQPVMRVIEQINPVLRGWVTYFAVGHSHRCFSYVRDWVDKKVRRHLMRARKRRGFRWKRWSRRWLYTTLGLHGEYHVRYLGAAAKALPIR
jgi:RNA-directed DNA polymerase